MVDYNESLQGLLLSEKRKKKKKEERKKQPTVSKAKEEF